MVFVCRITSKQKRIILRSKTPPKQLKYSRTFKIFLLIIEKNVYNLLPWRKLPVTSFLCRIWIRNYMFQYTTRWIMCSIFFFGQNFCLIMCRLRVFYIVYFKTFYFFLIYFQLLLRWIRWKSFNKKNVSLY